MGIIMNKSLGDDLIQGKGITHQYGRIWLPSLCFLLALSCAFAYEGRTFALLIGVTYVLHEMGHRLSAKRRRISIGWPLYVPILGSIVHIDNERTIESTISVINPPDLVKVGQLDDVAWASICGSLYGMLPAMIYSCLWLRFRTVVLADSAVYSASWNMLCLAPFWFDGRYSTSRMRLLYRVSCGVSMLVGALVVRSATILGIAALYLFPSTDKPVLSMFGERKIMIAVLALTIIYVLIFMVVGRGGSVGHSLHDIFPSALRS